jgi:hypothetical protein
MYIHSLFNDASSNSDCVAKNEEIIDVYAENDKKPKIQYFINIHKFSVIKQVVYSDHYALK